MIKKIKRKKDAKEKKRRIKAHPHHHPPHQLRNYEAGHTYGGLKIFFHDLAHISNMDLAYNPPSPY